MFLQLCQTHTDSAMSLLTSAIRNSGLRQNALRLTAEVRAASHSPQKARVAGAHDPKCMFEYQVGE